MYDLERIGKIIADLEKYFCDLDQFKVESPAMSKERFYVLSMLLFAIFNRTIDLGKEIIRGKKLGMPASYRQIFQILAKEKLISKELSIELEYLADRRNVLAHEYFDVTEQSIFSLYTKMKSVREFVIIARKIITSSGNGDKKKNK